MKLLVCGNVNGQFKALFSRVQSIIKKTGQFDYLLCTGSFFADTSECNEQWVSIKDGSLPVPLPIFILGPGNVECVKFYEGVPAAGGELVDNITCLGQRGLYVTSSGLQIAYLSGSYDPNEYHKLHVDNATLEDILSLCQYSEDESFKGVDILMASDWPQGVSDYATPPVSDGGVLGVVLIDGRGFDILPGAWKEKSEGLNNVQRIGSYSISKLAVHLFPRYHFSSTTEIFYERLPYRNHVVLSEHQKHATRFISLSNVGNPNKKNRYLYAFSVTPLKQLSKEELLQVPDGITDCPYQELLQKRKDKSASLGGREGHSNEGPSSNYFFDVKAIEETKKQQQREQDRLLRQLDPSVPSSKRRAPPRPQGPCWFCLGSPDIEKHLIVSIGSHSYLAFAKGGLVEEHLLILPIGHYQSSVDTPQEVLEEIQEFKKSLRKYFDTKRQSCIMFERNFRSQHLQIQVVPVPFSVESDTLRQVFTDAGLHHKLEFTEIERGSDLSEIVPSGVPYFVVEFSSGSSLLTRIKGRYFPLQFGREVLASPSVLNVPHKINWKDCALGKDEETDITLKFRDKFQPFDFTIDDDDDD